MLRPVIERRVVASPGELQHGMINSFRNLVLSGVGESNPVTTCAGKAWASESRSGGSREIHSDLVMCRMVRSRNAQFYRGI